MRASLPPVASRMRRMRSRIRRTPLSCSRRGRSHSSCRTVALLHNCTPPPPAGVRPQRRTFSQGGPTRATNERLHLPPFVRVKRPTNSKKFPDQHGIRTQYYCIFALCFAFHDFCCHEFHHDHDRGGLNLHPPRVPKRTKQRRRQRKALQQRLQQQAATRSC